MFTYRITALANRGEQTVLELVGTNGTVHAFIAHRETGPLRIGSEVEFPEQVDDGFTVSLGK